MAILAWAIKEKMFLKLQIGTGDNLNTQEILEDHKNYIIWNTFQDFLSCGREIIAAVTSEIRRL